MCITDEWSCWFEYGLNLNVGFVPGLLQIHWECVFISVQWRMISSEGLQIRSTVRAMNSKFKCTAPRRSLKRLDFYLLKYWQEICLVLEKSCSCQLEFVFFQSNTISCNNVHQLYTVLRKLLKVWICKLPSFTGLKFHSEISVGLHL